MSDVLLVALGLFGQWCLGAALALVIAGPRLIAMPARGFQRIIARSELLGLGCVLGIAVTGYGQFLWSLAGGPLGRSCSLAMTIAGPIIFGVVRWRCGRLASNESQSSGENGSAWGPLVGVCAALIGLIFVSATIQTLLTPQKFWDERAFYGLKAIVLFEDRSVHSPDLANPDFVQGHPRYPLLIPLAEQHVYALLGRVDDRWSKIVFPVLFMGLVLTFAGVLSRHLSGAQGWLGALLLATAPVLMPDDYGFLSGQADAPVACFQGVALLYLWDALLTRQSPNGSGRLRGRSLTLAGLAAAFGAFTKDEGLAYCAINAASFAGVLLIERRRAGGRREFLKGTLLLVLVPGMMLAPWLWHRRHLPLTGEMNYFGRLREESLGNGLASLAWSIPHLASRMFSEAGTWGLQWWFLLTMLILFPGRALKTPQLFLLLNLTGALAALLVAGMVAPVAVEEHIGGSSHRYLMQLTPAALLFAMGQFREP